MAVRQESVELSVTGDLTAELLQAAAAAQTLAGSLNRLNGQNVNVGTSSNTITRNLNQTSQAMNRSSGVLDSYTGRLGLLASVAGTIAPALVPIGAVAVPAVTGLANALGAAALAGGTAILAFQGVGDALTAVNDAALEPSGANLEKAEAALSALSPAAIDLVMRLQELRPAFDGLRDIGAENMFPGVLDALDSIETRIPEVERIIARVSATTGGLIADAGASLASSDFDDFFAFLEREVPTTLTTLGQAVGNAAKGLADLWMAFDPLNDDFNGVILRASQSFADWADNLSQTQGFTDFVAYVRQSGPQVAEAVGAIANALVQIVTAAAPLGGVVLAGIEGFANAIAAIAGSDFGVPIMAAVTAMSALNLAMGAFSALRATTIVTNLTASFTGLNGAMLATSTAASAAQLGLVGLATFGAATLLDQMFDVTQSAEEMSAALEGLAAGEVNDQISNLGVGFNSLGDALSSAAFDDLGSIMPDFMSSVDEIEAMDAALGDLARNSPAQAAAAFNTIQAQAEDAGLSLDQLLELFPQYRQALSEMGELDPTDWFGGIREGFGQVAEGIQSAIDDSLPGRADAVADAMAGIGQEALTASESADALRNSLDALLGPGLDLSAATDAYESSLRGLNDALSSNTRSLVGFGEGAVQNREAIRSLVANTTDLLVAQREAGAGSGRLGATFREGIDDIMAFGTAAGLSREQLRGFLTQIGFTPKVVRTVMQTVGIEEAAANARQLREDFSALPRDVRTRIKADGIPQTKAQLNDLDKAVGGLTKKERRIIVDLMDAAARGKVHTLEGLLKHLDGQRPTPKADVDAGAAHRGLDGVSAHVHQVDQQHASPTVTADVGSALSGINAVLSAMSRIQNKSVTITTFHQDVGRQGIGDQNADGGLYENGIRTFASGGFSWPRIGDQQPQLRPYTGPRGLTWSEEGSGPWEAFISGHPSKQIRSRTIADDVVRRLGGEVMWRAADGMLLERRMQQRGMPAPQVVVTQPGDLRIVGTLDTPFGPAEVRGIARAEVDANDRRRDRRARVGART